MGPREGVRARLVLVGAQRDFLAHQLHPIQVERDRLGGDVVPGNLRSVTASVSPRVPTSPK